MDILPTDGAGAPARWFIVFHRRADLWWVNLIPGRFKHVQAFAHVPETDTWIFYTVGLGRTGIVLARGAGARFMIDDRIQGAVVLSIAPQISDRLTVFPFCCTTAVANLIGLPRAPLRPDALYRECKRAGALPLVPDSPTLPAWDNPARKRLWAPALARWRALRSAR